MEEYGRNYFIDDRVKPVHTNIFGARMNGEWELAELPFEQISDILKSSIKLLICIKPL